MAALDDLSDWINRITGGNSGTPDSLPVFKVARVAGAAAAATISGRHHSLWRYEGMPSAGAVPTAAAIPDRATFGAMPFKAPGGGREKFLTGTCFSGLVGGTVELYDRLFHIGGLSGAVTTPQTVQGSTPTPALTRNTGGAGNFAFYEIYTALGSTPATLTMTYTNQSGVTGKTSTINIGGTGFREQGRAQKIPLAAGDSGIRAVESVQLSGSTGAAGDFGITIANMVEPVVLASAGIGGWRDWTTGVPGMPSVDPDACYALLFYANTTTAPEIGSGLLHFLEK